MFVIYSKFFSDSKITQLYWNIAEKVMQAKKVSECNKKELENDIIEEL